MTNCVLDGAALADQAAVYRALADALGFPGYFGQNPDALWDALSERLPRDTDNCPEITWRRSGRSAERLGPGFDRIVAVLRQAAAEGRLRLTLE